MVRCQAGGGQNLTRIAKALASYRIGKPRNPENRRKIGKIWENPIFCLFLVCFSNFLPIFLLFSEPRGFPIL